MPLITIIYIYINKYTIRKFYFVDNFCFNQCLLVIIMKSNYLCNVDVDRLGMFVMKDKIIYQLFSTQS